MNKNMIKRAAMTLSCTLTTWMFCGTGALAATTTTTDAAAQGFADVVQPIVKLLNSLIAPLLAIVGAAGSLYCILLGVKFAKAEEPQDREKAKTHLKNAIIGFVLIFVLILALNLLMDPMINWVNANAAEQIINK